MTFSFLQNQATFDKLWNKKKKKAQKTIKAPLYVTFMLDLTMMETIMMRCVNLAIIQKNLLRLAREFMQQRNHCDRNHHNQKVLAE